jgi:nucleotide-binding universal stress UspA family protein
MYDTIIVPTDGSEHAHRAAEDGLYLADLFESSVHALHVTEQAGGADADEDPSERAQRVLAEVEAVAGDASRVRTAVLEGDPTDAIVEYAEEFGADLLAMGTHGRTGVNRYVAGSVTESVLRRSDAPVLTARATERGFPDAGYDDVLVPTDGSEAAAAALEHAIDIGGAVDATLHAVNIVDAGGARAAPRFTLPSEMLTEFESIGEAATEEFADRARDAGLDAVSVVREGAAANSLLSYVDEEDIDLVTMGTQGRTGIDRYLLGSTTERLVRHSSAPVVAVNAREDSD